MYKCEFINKPNFITVADFGGFTLRLGHHFMYLSKQQTENGIVTFSSRFHSEAVCAANIKRCNDFFSIVFGEDNNITVRIISVKSKVKNFEVRMTEEDYLFLRLSYST